MKTSYTSKTQRGFSLLELLLVVGVGAVLILAGLSAYRLVSEGNSATQSLRQLQTLKQQVQQAYQGETGYGTAANQSLIATLQAMRMLPPDMTPNAATGAVSIRNSFNNTTTIVSGATTGSFIITFNGVSASACNKMGVAFSTATSSDFVGVRAGAPGLATTGGTLRTTPTVVTMSGDCDRDASTMHFEFR